MHGSGYLVFSRMVFCDSSYQLEWPEGIKALAAILSYPFASLLIYDGFYLLRIFVGRVAAGVDAEDCYGMWQRLFDIFSQIFIELTEIYS